MRQVASKDSDDAIPQLILLDNLCWASDHVIDLLGQITRILPTLKKERPLIALSLLISKVMWEWIRAFPAQFALWQQAPTDSKTPDSLFEMLSVALKKKQTKNLAAIWPAQMMLLILNPGSILRAAEGTGSEHESKASFLQGLKDALRNPKTATLAAEIYVSLQVVATYMSRTANQSNPIQFVISAVEPELKGRYLPQSKPEDPQEDERVTIDFLCAAWRLSPAKVVNSFFRELLGSPTRWIKIFVSTLLRIASEKTQLPWWQSFGTLVPFGSDLRSIFNKIVANTGQNQASRKSSTLDKKMRLQLEKMEKDLELCIPILELFNLAPELALYGEEFMGEGKEMVAREHQKEINTLISGVAYLCASAEYMEIEPVALKTLLTLHRLENINNWSYEKSNLINCYTEVRSTVNREICVGIMRPDISTESLLVFVTSLEEILRKRNAFLEQLTFIDKSVDFASLVLGTKSLESALIVALASHVEEISSKAAICLGLLCHELELLRFPNLPDYGIYTNFAAYKEIGLAPERKKGQAHQQKLLRASLVSCNYTAASLSAWEEIHRRWELLSPIIKEESFEATLKRLGLKVLPSYVAGKTYDEVKEMWHNYLGFLCALSGITVGRTKPVPTATPGATNNTVRILAMFMKNLIESFLTSPVTYVRESVVTLVGGALAPKAYSELMNRFYSILQTFFGSKGEAMFSPVAERFVALSLQATKIIFERPLQEERDDSFSQIEQLEEFLLLLLQYVNQTEMSVASLKIKKTMCQLLNLVMTNRAYLIFSSEQAFRIQVVDTIMGWTSILTKKSGASVRLEEVVESTQTATKEVEALFSDLDLAVLSAMSTFLLAFTIEEAEGSTHVRNYFTFLESLLSERDLQENIRATAIGALSNLLFANAETGLSFFLTMGYHKDPDTRGAFLRVISNILNQGAAFQNDDDEPYEQLLELLVDSKQHLSRALQTVTGHSESGNLASLLVRLFDARGKALPLVFDIVEAEILKTAQPETLLRNNTLATKTLTAYAKLIGLPYLKATLSPVMERVDVQVEGGLVFEIDPAKLDNLDSDQAAVVLESAASHLCAAVAHALVSIQENMHDCPLQVRQIANFLYEVTKKNYPGAEKTAVAGFIFLRFFCPGLVAPELWGLTTDKIGVDLRRAYVLVAKIMQYIANGILSPDSAAQWINPFIQANIPRCAELLEEFAKVPTDAPVMFGSVTPDIQNDLVALHSLCFEFRPKIEAYLKQTGDNKALKVASQLNVLLTRLGAPREAPERRATILASKSSGNTEAYNNFMQRMNGVNVSEIEGKAIFQEVGRALDGATCYQYVARRFQPGFNVDMFLYYLLKNMSSALIRPYALIVDLTLLSSENLVSIPWLTRFATIVPPALKANLTKIFLLNPNKQFKDYSKRLSRIIPTHKIEICSNVAALDKYIARSEARIQPATLRLDVVQATFQVVRVTQYKVAKELTFKLTSDALELVTAKPTSLYGTNVQLREFYPIGGLENVKQQDDFEFSLKFDREPKTITYKSASCTQLVQALKSTRARFDLQNARTGVKARLRPADLPGTLMNMAFLNAQHPNTSLRGQAYNLLAALCNSFDFAAREKLLELQGLSIPQENSRFVVQMSSLIAKTEPQITLEFLAEAINTLQTAPPSLKGYIMLYIQPWLPNLALFAYNQENPQQIAKTTKILVTLLQWTIQEEMIKSVATARIWETLGSVANLLGMIVKLCLTEACAHSAAVPTIADVFCALAAKNSQFIAGKLIAKTLTAIRKAADKPVELLSDHPLWANITVYLRILLWLSFNDRLCVTKYLPEIFHIVMCTVTTGDLLTRNTVHALTLNSLHSLYTELSSGFKSGATGDLQKLYHSIDALNQRSIHLVFGISANLMNPFTAAGAVPGGVVDRLDIGNIETTAAALLTALSAASPEGKAQATPWHGRWMTLTTEAAMRPCPIMQARAFATLGVISGGDRRIVTIPLLSRVLNVLKTTLQRPTGERLKIHGILETAILSCVTRMLPVLDLTTLVVRQLFWLGCSLLVINQDGVFKASVRLIEELLKALDASGTFDLNPLSAFFMGCRGRLESSLKKLDEITSINFRHSFDFALVAHLVKGVRQQTTKPLAVSFVSSILSIAAKSEAPDALLGYLALLLVDPERFDSDQVAPWAKGKDLSDILWTKMVCSDLKHGALLFALLSTLVRSSVNEREKALLYKTLAAGLRTLPQAAPVVAGRIFPLLNQIIQRSQSAEMANHVLAIVEALPVLVMEPASFSEFKQGTLPEATLESTGFGAIFQADRALVETDVLDRPSVIVRKVIAHMIEVMLQDESDLTF